MTKQDNLEKSSSADAGKYSPLILHSIIGDTADLFAAVDTNYNFLSFNTVFEKQFLQVYGIQLKNGDNLRDVLAHLPEEQKKVTQAWGRALRGEEYEFIQEFGDKNFSSKFFSIKFKTLWDNNDQVLGAYQIVKDLSELKNAKNQLVDSEAIFHSFFDSSPMMMGVAEIEENDIRHISDNKAASEFFGLPPEIMKGKQASELGVSNKEINFWLEHYRRAQRTRLPQHFDYIHRTDSGPRHLSVVVSLIGNNLEGSPRFSYIAHDVTIMKQAEKDLIDSKRMLEQRILERTKTLQSSQQNFERMFNLAPFALAVVKKESGIIVHVNSAWSTLTGYSAQEAIGKSTLALGLFDDLSERENIYLEFRATGRVRNADFQLRSKAQELRSILCNMDNIELVGFSESEQNFVLVTMEDITERKLAEEAVKLEQHRLTSVIENSPSCLSLKSADGKYLIANPNYDRILGTMSESMIGKTDHDIFPEYVAEAMRKNDLVVLSGQKLSVEEYVPRADGVILTFMSHKFPITNLEGKIESVCSISLDITARKKAERDLQYQFQLVKTITDNAASSLFMMDKFGHPTFMNPAAKKTTGYETLEEIKDRPLHYAVHWKKPDGSAYPMEDCPIDNAQAEKNQVQNQEELFCKKDGTLFPVSYSVSPLEKDGETIGSVLEFRDITQEKKFTQDLRDSKERLRNYATSLEEALRSRDDFLSIASHELKTPLTSLKLYAQLAKRNRDRGDELVYGKENVDRLIDQIDKQSARLARLIDDMLDISRIRTGKLNLQLEKFDLHSLLIDVLERLEPNFKEAGNSIFFKCTSPLFMHGDRYRIDQVITNILTNAMKYASRKPIHINVEIKTETPPLIHISIHDEGIGIASESLERIFNQFERAISANEVSGLGLGLFITRQIVEAHGGKIWAESEGLDHGSTFNIEFPAE